MTELNRRVILIDDTSSIHADFHKILGTNTSPHAKNALADAKAAFFGGSEETPATGADAGLTFDLDSAHQGAEGLEKVRAAFEAGQPYAMAFVDVRMPPGWDGVETIEKLWEVDDRLQVVICTAYSDYTWSETLERLGQSDQLLILKKPFDSTEIRQLATALTEKWNAARREEKLFDDLRRAEAEANSYASSLETVNRALTTAQATSDRASEMKSEFLMHLSGRVHESLTRLLANFPTEAGQTGAAELEELLESSTGLVRTLDRILDLHSVEEQGLAIHSEPAPVFELLEKVLEEHRAAAAERGLTLALRVPEAVPESVLCDAERAAQVIGMLIESAVLESRDGEVRARLEMLPTADWKTSLLSVTVDGPGPPVPEEERPSLFEPFALRRSSASDFGLALPLARLLARRMGGDVVLADEGERTSLRATFEVGNVSGAGMVQG